MNTQTITDPSEALAIVRASGHAIPRLPAGVKHLTVPIVTAVGQPAIAIVSKTGLKLIVCRDTPAPANAGEQLSRAALRLLAT
ncbi:MAG: hypothetical protein ACKV19_02485 [Verrucomicrobiales bacterium]